ncbi:MAG: PHP domain-containing protein [Clostridia bacterium]|nr:PHP domain-containing protein [Clostridia bacterium]
MKIYYDFHLHSCLSPCGDDDMTPNNIAGMAHLNGLNAIALTDHNTTLNCAPLKKAAERYGITVLYGMELTTDEEVHMVCLFADEQSASKWEEYVAERLMKIDNNPDIFGHQHIMDEQDNIIGERQHLLINAVNLSFENVFGLVEALGGVAYPAHVDKNANSLISNLGFVPPDSIFKLAELHDPKNLGDITAAHPYFKGCKILSSSDAHYLTDINEAQNFIETEENTPEAIIKALKK